MIWYKASETLPPLEEEVLAAAFGPLGVFYELVELFDWSGDLKWHDYDLLKDIEHYDYWAEIEAPNV